MKISAKSSLWLWLQVLCLLQFYFMPAECAIRSRHSKNAAELQKKTTTNDEIKDNHSDKPSDNINTDFRDKMSWSCLQNASCLYALANDLKQSYYRGDTIKLGFFDLVKVPKKNKAHKSNVNITSYGDAESGRSISTFVDFISGNAIRIPIGPMVFSVQRSEEDGDYIELALLRKTNSQGNKI